MVNTVEPLKVSIFEIGNLEVEVESIPEYDLVAQMQKDLQDQLKNREPAKHKSLAGAFGSLAGAADV